MSPEGSLLFSFILRAPPALAGKLVFVQYLFALAVVEAVHQIYGDIGLRIKWPNDIYARVGTDSQPISERYKKVGGILVNSSYAGGDFTLVIGKFA